MTRSKEDWELCFKQQEASGKSQARYCVENEISLSSFNHARRKLGYVRKKARKTKPRQPTQFAVIRPDELKPPPESFKNPSVKITSACGDIWEFFI